MKKAEILTLNELENELYEYWGFNPYKIESKATSIHRFSTSLKVVCKNCNSKLQLTAHQMGLLKDKKQYCSECLANFNIDNIERPNLDDYVCPEKYKKNMTSEFEIMQTIIDNYKFNPYRFIDYSSGKYAKLEHRCCNTSFLATPEMLFENRNFEDIHRPGKKVMFPYCPKCDEFIKDTTKNYGGTILIEMLDRHFEGLKIDFPYVFKEENIYLFKAFEQPIVVTCKYCNHDFTEKPENLFTMNPNNKGSWSLCPYCNGLPKTDDTGIDESEQISADNKYDKLNKEKDMNKTSDETVKVKVDGEIKEVPASIEIDIPEKETKENEKQLSQDEVDAIVNKSKELDHEKDDMLYDPDKKVNREEPEFANPKASKETEEELGVTSDDAEDFEPTLDETIEEEMFEDNGFDNIKYDIKEELEKSFGIEFEEDDEIDESDEEETEDYNEIEKEWQNKLDNIYLENYGAVPELVQERAFKYANLFNEYENRGGYITQDEYDDLKDEFSKIPFELIITKDGANTNLIIKTILRLFVLPLDWEDYSNEELDKENETILTIINTNEQEQNELEVDIINLDDKKSNVELKWATDDYEVFDDPDSYVSL